MSDATNSNIPNPGVPFLDQSGRITQVWWAFLLAMFQRTGGTGTPTPPAQIDYTPLIDAQVPYSLFQPEQDAPAPVAYPHVAADAPPEPVSAPYVPADPVEDIFTAGPSFTPGTTTTLTLSKVYTSKAAVLVHFDGTFQATDQYSVSGNTIIFTSAIPVGVSKVYARG
ncbi:hypothetical protein LMG28727_04867 [Paraburkholderia kirstenboschensis]|uniref:hypothetical protein n=1 Tax=Paraburkholderia kirstenboschensis TaxID=1245436 RepID=UPI000A839992|nr:hypothetical protein [Paraburkholderia kirstenboschensis]CAD6548636.1 hypothetical protein LMG28727_04867 [Paraburkholderia kirstenboschensis]